MPHRGWINPGAIAVLPPELLDFLAKHIDSIAQLEALLLLGENDEIVWQVPELAKRLYIAEEDALEVLSHLDTQGLVVREGNVYRYAPASDELARSTSLLAEYYRRHLIAITNIVHAKPRRIRQFAEAFKLKKE